MCEQKDYASLKLCPAHRKIVEDELRQWHITYRPESKKVLDIGAGCGETAQFYLKHGTQLVVCVEANPECYKNLVENFGKDPRVHLVPRMWVDGIKIDIDGSEENMLVETHFPHEWRVIAQDLQDSTRFYQLIRK